MEIFFDFELDEQAEQPKDPNNFVFTTIRDFVKARYSVLDATLDNLIGDNEAYAAVIRLAEDGLEVTPINIPESVKEKFDKCLTQEDVDYVLSLVHKMIESEDKSSNH